MNKLQELCNKYCFDFYEYSIITGDTIGGNDITWNIQKHYWLVNFWRQFINLEYEDYEGYIIFTPLNKLTFIGFPNNINKKSYEIKIEKIDGK